MQGWRGKLLAPVGAHGRDDESVSIRPPACVAGTVARVALAAVRVMAGRAPLLRARRVTTTSAGQPANRWTRPLAQRSLASDGVISPSGTRSRCRSGRCASRCSGRRTSSARHSARHSRSSRWHNDSQTCSRWSCSCDSLRAFAARSIARFHPARRSTPAAITGAGPTECPEEPASQWLSAELLCQYRTRDRVHERQCVEREPSAPLAIGCRLASWTRCCSWTTTRICAR